MVLRTADGKDQPKIGDQGDLDESVAPKGLLSTRPLRRIRHTFTQCDKLVSKYAGS